MMECIIKPKFEVTDWLNRYEFQGRGSSHNHGFMWSKDGPVLVVDDLESRRTFAQFWGVYFSGILPINVDRALDRRTAMSLPPENDQNTLRQLDMLVNHLQRHICTPSYCLRPERELRPIQHQNVVFGPLGSTRRVYRRQEQKPRALDVLASPQ